jgi:hypothetical protein
MIYILENEIFFLNEFCFGPIKVEKVITKTREKTKDNFVMIIYVPVDAFSYKYSNTFD